MSDDTEFGGAFVWEPNPETIERAHLTQFMRRHSLPSFEALMDRSTNDVAWFTEALLEYLEIQFSQPYSKVVDLSEGIAWPKW